MVCVHQMKRIHLGLIVFGLFPLVDASTALASNQRVFADKLVSELYQEENECTSSLGISMAFSLIYPSADATNQEQMQAVLGYPSSETNLQLLWDETQNRLGSKYDGRCLEQDPENEEECDLEVATLEVVNRVWIADSLMVGDQYTNILGDLMFQMNFDSGDAGNVINNWVSSASRGLIDSVVDEGPLPGGVELVAVSATYLKASWVHQFNPEMTNVDSFYTSPTRLMALPSQVNYMHTVNDFDYSDSVPGFQILRLPFRGSLSMIIALPFSEDTSTIEFDTIHPALSSLKSTKVAIALPKFRFGSVYEDKLMTALRALGLTAPFEGGLCFGGEGGCNSFVSSVIHRTMIEVNELGVEAAAATAVLVSREGVPEPEVPVLFLANHPFQFFIYENEEELVLFEGRVGDPGSTYSVKPPALDVRHDDENFWTGSFNVDPREPNSAAPLVSTYICGFVGMIFVAVSLVF